MTRMQRLAVWVGVLCCWTSLPAQDPIASLLQDDRYVDPIHGFRIAPPPMMRRVVDEDSQALVQWVEQQAETGDYQMSLRVDLSVMDLPGTDMDQCAQLAKRILQQDPKAEVGAYVVTEIDGWPGFVLDGTTQADLKTGEQKIAFYHLWIRKRAAKEVVLDEGTAGMNPMDRDEQVVPKETVRLPTQFLVFKMAAPAEKAETLRAQWAAVRDSLHFFDPQPLLEEVNKSSTRAAKRLGALARDSDSAARWKDSAWFRVTRDNRDLGWLRMETELGERQGIRGLLVRQWGKLQLPDQPVRAIREILVADFPQDKGNWRIHTQFGGGRDATLTAEDGMRQDDLILCLFLRNQRQTQQQLRLPEGLNEFFLPKAFGRILPRILDLGEKTTYTFADYDSRSNDFVMRTVTILGPEELNRDGRLTSAIKLLDQPAVGARPLELWVDSDGRVLRRRHPDGTTLDRVDEALILSLDPTAEDLIRALDLAEQKSQK